MWTELQVWVGVAPQEKGHRWNNYHISPVRDFSRRATRLVKQMSTKLELTPGREYDPQAHTLERVEDLAHTNRGQ